MNKRQSKAGTIRQRKDGLYEVRYVFDGQRKSIYCKTEQEAHDRLQKINANIVLENHFEPSKMKLERWLNVWLYEHKKKILKPKTFASYEQIIRLYLSPKLGAIPIGSLSPDMIQRTLHQMTVSSRTVRYTFTVLKMALKKAKENKMLRDMPTDGVVLPKQQAREINILSNEDLDKFLHAIRAHRYEAAFLLALFAGMRRGEILALQWQDIDFKAGLIRVNKTLDRIKTFDGDKIAYNIIVNDSKTAKGVRVLPILPEVNECLKSHYTRSQLNNKVNPCDFVFQNKHGRNVSPRKFADYFYKILKKSDISPINFHALRHTYATMSLEEGVDPKTLSVLLGHASVSFTMDIYCHVTNKQKIKEIDKLRPIFLRSRGKVRGKLVNLKA